MPITSSGTSARPIVGHGAGSPPTSSPRSIGHNRAEPKPAPPGPPGHLPGRIARRTLGADEVLAVGAGDDPHQPRAQDSSELRGVGRRHLQDGPLEALAELRPLGTVESAGPLPR